MCETESKIGGIIYDRLDDSRRVIDRPGDWVHIYGANISHIAKRRESQMDRHAPQRPVTYHKNWCFSMHLRADLHVDEMIDAASRLLRRNFDFYLTIYAQGKNAGIISDRKFE